MKNLFNAVPQQIRESQAFKLADANMQQAIAEAYAGNRDSKGGCGICIRSQQPLPGSRRHPHGR